MVVEAGQEEDIREEVFYALSRNKCPILQMRPMDMSSGRDFPEPDNRRRRKQQMTAVFLKELRTYFTTPIGYIFMGVFLLISGILFTTSNVFAMNSDYSSFLGSLILYLSAGNTSSDYEDSQ